jgi:hypothetical protein
MRRLAITRWPNDFANGDWRYGANTAYIRELADYWRNEYDWRSRERMMYNLRSYRGQSASNCCRR